MTSRLESLTKEFGIRIAASLDAIEEWSVTGEHRTRGLGTVSVKGKWAPVEVCEIYDNEDEDRIGRKDSILGVFAEGIEAFSLREFDEATAKFVAVLEVLPDDEPSRHYIRLARKLSS